MRHYHNSNLSFIDLLMNAVAVFVMLFILAAIQINAIQQKTKKVDEKAKIMIIMSWDDNSADDIDLWLKTPEPMKIGYNSPNGSIANLERDDIGMKNDFYKDNNGKIQFTHLNREVTTIRKAISGHYVVNAHFYRRQENPETGITSKGPVTVTMQLIQIDPVYKELKQKTFQLEKEFEEKTAFSFDVENESVIDVQTDIQEKFVYSNVGTSTDSSEDFGPQQQQETEDN